MKKMLSVMLAFAMLISCTVSAFAAPFQYGPFTINAPKEWSLSDEDGMLMVVHEDYPMFMGLLMYMELPTGMANTQETINSFLTDYTNSPTEFDVNGLPAAYVVTNMQEGALSSKTIIASVGYGSHVMLFIGMDITEMMSPDAMLDLACSLLETISIGGTDASSQVEAGEGYQLSKFIMQFEDDLEVEMDQGALFAMNIDTLTILSATTISFPFDLTVNTSYDTIAEGFFSGLGDTSNEKYTETTVHGTPALQFNADLAQDGLPMSVYGYIVLSGNDALCLAGMSLPSLMDNVISSVEYTIETLTFAE